MSEQNEAEVDVSPSESETPELTSWANEPTIRELKQDYEDSRSSHDSHRTKVSEWLDNLNVENAAKPKVGKGKSATQPKVIRKQAEWRYAALSEPFLSTPDIYNTAPTSAEDKESATQNGLILNHQFNNRLDKVTFMDELVRTLVDEGTAIVRVGWDTEIEEVTEKVPVYNYVPDLTAVDLHNDLHRMMQEEPAVYESQSAELIEAHKYFMETGVPYMPFRTDEFEEVTELKETKNQPTVEVCDYRNIYVDPTSKGNLDDAGFIIYSFETSLSELKKDGDRYKNLDRININTNSIIGDPDHYSEEDSSFNFSDKPRKKFVAYEYWGYRDIDGTGIAQPFVATWVGNQIIRMERNPFPDQKLPFVSIQYLPVRKSTYGEPDGELLKDNQKIIGAVTRGMVDSMARSANAQIGARKDALDTVNRIKFNKGLDYEYNPGVSPADAFYMHQYPEPSNAAQVMLGMQHADAESLSGVKAFNNGITGEALGDSTGLGKSALDAASKREMGILRRLSEGMRKIGLKIIAMNGQFLSEKESVRITGEEFITIRRDALEGNFDLKLSISTPEADAAKAEELAFMLQTMDNTTPPELRNMLLAEIADLRNMPELAKKLRNFVPQPDPIAQEKAQLENELIRAQIAEKMANAGQKQAAKDKTTLDHVEQEEGVAHARELEIAGEQAKSNLERDIVKGVMDRGKEDAKAAQTNKGE